MADALEVRCFWSGLAEPASEVGRRLGGRRLDRLAGRFGPRYSSIVERRAQPKAGGRLTGHHPPFPFRIRPRTDIKDSISSAFLRRCRRSPLWLVQATDVVWNRGDVDEFAKPGREDVIFVPPSAERRRHSVVECSQTLEVRATQDGAASRWKQVSRRHPERSRDARQHCEREI